jgi:hypothetical protein
MPVHPTTIDGPAHVSVQVTTGRFLWVSGPWPAGQDAAGLVRIAIADPDPGGRPVFLGSSVLAHLPDASLPHRAAFLATAEFVRAAPVLRSDLFVTADLTHLTLRYPRP